MLTVKTIVEWYTPTSRTIGDMNAKVGQNNDNKEVVIWETW